MHPPAWEACSGTGLGPVCHMRMHLKALQRLHSLSRQLETWGLPLPGFKAIIYQDSRSVYTSAPSLPGAALPHVHAHSKYLESLFELQPSTALISDMLPPVLPDAAPLPAHAHHTHQVSSQAHLRSSARSNSPCRRSVSVCMRSWVPMSSCSASRRRSRASASSLSSCARRWTTASTAARSCSNSSW